MDKNSQKARLLSGEVLTNLPVARQVFDVYADRYDAWYDSSVGKILFSAELACLRPLLEQFARPYLEVGVGTGRFAEALGIEYGLDPSPRALEKARVRGVKVTLGIGEELPFPDARFGGVLLVFTLCFVEDPNKVIQEIRRVLTPGGGLVLGVLLKDTPWADSYARRGAEGHPLYSTARFYSREEVEDLLKQSDFRITAYRSTLFQKPGLEVYKEESPVDGLVPGAGFVGIAAVKANNKPQVRRR